MKKPLIAGVIAFLLAASAAATRADTVTVVTSFPKELSAAYKKAYEQRHPGTTVEILSMSTEAAISHVEGTRPGERPDVFWASAPHAFQAMAREGLLAKAPEVKNPAVPPSIGKYPMNDPAGFYFGQALSGYGIMWNKRYFESRRLPAPQQWQDLTKEMYFGHVAMSAPSRSATTHLTVETILQGEGWLRGWTQVLQIAGNCKTITERSFDVPEGVGAGTFGAGLVIDFFGLASKYTGKPVDFIYPAMTAVVPASIALVNGGRNAEGGKRFMAFALSRHGQEILLEPKISRIPVLPYGDLLDSVPGTYPNIFGIVRRVKVTFDPNLAESRRLVVSGLFDRTIGALLPELQAATAAIHDAERVLGERNHERARALLARARAHAYTPVLEEPKAGAGNSLKSSADAAEKLVAASGPKWQEEARLNYRKAQQLASEAAAMLR
ncbi:MAG TPA: extracellular solute-binding protein [Noviherbaspirillum sp.]|jgi:ABC-type Fe3+ transport system substrate-binding protein|uniref:ABC transporter substrate-binding protein n=1 Tax=Noviherbaspirillum sp. TaxID=1926288 RepID=UPI002F9416EF